MVTNTRNALAVEEIDFGPGVALPFPAKAADERPAPPSLPVVVHRPDQAERHQQVLPEEALVEQLGVSLARAILPIFRELQSRGNPELTSMKQLVDQHHERLQAAVEGIFEVQGSVERLSQAMSEQQASDAAGRQKSGELALAIAALQQSGAQQKAEAARVREEIETLASAARNGEALSARAEAQQQEIQALKAGFGDLSPKLETTITTLDRQSELIRRLSHTHAERDEALDLLAEALARWKASRETAQAPPR